MKAVNADAPQPAYVYDNSPEGELSYDASFYFDPNSTNSGGEPIDIFTGLDQNGQPAFGIQYEVEGSEYQIRGWAMQNGVPVYMDWVYIADAPQEIEVAWLSDANAGFSLFVDGRLTGTVIGDTSAYQLDEVLLGPSSNLAAGASGTMYFDEFTSSRLSAVLHNVYMSVLFK